MGVKWVMFVRRRKGLSHQEFREHYEGVHVPLAMKLLPWIKRYVRNYFPPDSDTGFDVATEFWFDSEADEAATKAWYAADESQTLQRDEETFMDRDTIRLFTVVEDVTVRK
ncbi:MAG TPA: EthD domain-containing protein [Novosphingobium sp.]|nr:EthD domain-containing protein [Novosphingobium sp.]